MTANDAIALANAGGIAGPNLDLGAILKNKLLPEYLSAALMARWRRATTTLDLSPASRAYALPADCETVLMVWPGGTTDVPLPNIGEDSLKVLQAERGTTPAGSTCGYYVRIDAGAIRTLYLDRLPSAAGTLWVEYRKTLVWAGPPSNVDLDLLIPVELQWGLVEGLRREIYSDRVGQGDQRFQTADAEWRRYLGMVSQSADLAPQGDYFVDAR
jgi:hypothetical protein